MAELAVGETKLWKEEGFTCQYLNTCVCVSDTQEREELAGRSHFKQGGGRGG